MNSSLAPAFPAVWTSLMTTGPEQPPSLPDGESPPESPPGAGGGGGSGGTGVTSFRDRSSLASSPAPTSVVDVPVAQAIANTQIATHKAPPATIRTRRMMDAQFLVRSDELFAAAAFSERSLARSHWRMSA